MENLYPIAKLGSAILIIDKSNIPFVGKERALEVKCVKIDLERYEIDELWELEKHLKFNPWEEIVSEGEKNIVLKLIQTKFSDEDIAKRIVQPLLESRLSN